MKWLDHWRDALLSWGAFVSDLANQPADFLDSHSYVFFFKFTFFLSLLWMFITLGSYLVYIVRRRDVSRKDFSQAFSVREPILMS
jgi:hypothetical protein